MLMSEQEFLGVLDSAVAKGIFKDKYITEAFKDFKNEHKAALLHANGITSSSDMDHAFGLIHLVAAFHNKDVQKIEDLVAKGISVGARLDYFLPLYDTRFHAGEDIFVAAVKVLMGGDKNRSVKLELGQMIHKVGDAVDTPYSKEENGGYSWYVNESFKIREILKAAPNKAIIQPTQSAIEYILNNSKTYRDSNDNPVIVFIPGVTSVKNTETQGLRNSDNTRRDVYYAPNHFINQSIQYGGNKDDIGFFGVPGIVWSVIMGDVDGVNEFLQHNASVNIEDEFGIKTLAQWAAATLNAVEQQGHDENYKDRLLKIMEAISGFDNQPNSKNNFGKTVFEYTPVDSRGQLPKKYRPSAAEFARLQGLFKRKVAAQKIVKLIDNSVYIEKKLAQRKI